MLSIYDISVYETGVVPTIVPEVSPFERSASIANCRDFGLGPLHRTQRFFSESNIAAKC